MATTPGPWTWEYRFLLVAGDKEILARDETRDGPSEDDASLIAAAPDLLAALKKARRAVYAIAESSHLLEGFGPRRRTAPDDDLELLDAAIAKAEGQS